MANFLLVRHGITDRVEDRILHGSTNTTLNKKGQIQVKKTAQLLRECGRKKIYELD